MIDLDNDDLAAAYSDRLKALTDLKQVFAFDGDLLTRHERDLIELASSCIFRALDAWGQRTGAREAWEAWVYPELAARATETVTEADKRPGLALQVERELTGKVAP